MTDEFMARPTDVLLMAIGELTQDEASAFQAGRMAMGLEVITVVRSLQELSILSVSETATVVSVLQTLLTDQGLEPQAAELYVRLSAMRRPTFVPVEPSLLHDADADVPEELRDDVLASLAEETEDAASRVDGIRELLRERRSQGDVTIDVTFAEDEEEERGMSSE